MTKLEIWVSDEDMDRLWAIKAQRGENDMSGNEFARELLEDELYRLHPCKVPPEEV